MGKIRMGPPESLVLFLKGKIAAKRFVETGTFMGGTAAWAASHFEEVCTIELSPDYHAAAVKRFAENGRVRALEGNSPRVLADLLPRIDGPAIFWLDAHWSGLDTSGRESECPLLEELAQIDASPFPHVILVDDARLFGAPPPAPHRASDWPDLQTTVAALAGAARRHVVLWDDVLVAVPSELKDDLVGYLRVAPASESSGRSWWRRGIFR